MEDCQAQVAETTGRGLHKGYRECFRKAWKDGYCKQHHPETIKAKKVKEHEKYLAWHKTTRSYAREKCKEARVALVTGNPNLALKILDDFLNEK
jgi:hypothetical protein